MPYPPQGTVVRDQVTADIATHAALDTGVHGAGGDVIVTDQDIADHAAETTGVHGL